MKKFLLFVLFTFLSSCGVQGLLQEAKVKETAGNTAEALELYKKAVAQDLNSLEARESLGKLYVSLGRHLDASITLSGGAATAEIILNNKPKQPNSII